MLTGYPDTLADLLAWARVGLMIGLVALVLWLGWERLGHDGD